MLDVLNPEPLLVSTGIVALAEVGDKTQLLSLILAARFQKPWPIIVGILLATLANHSVAAMLGHWITSTLSPDALSWILGVSFLAMAIWMLIPDHCDDTDTGHTRFGVLGATLIAFFLAEMGDKTQVATVALAAQYGSLVSVVAGTTLGMMIANVPMVFLGKTLADRLPVRPIHITTALLFALLGVTGLFGTEANRAAILGFAGSLGVLRHVSLSGVMDAVISLLIAGLLGGLSSLTFRPGPGAEHGRLGVVVAVWVAAWVQMAVSMEGDGHLAGLLGDIFLGTSLLASGLLLRDGKTATDSPPFAKITLLFGASACGVAVGGGWTGTGLVIGLLMLALNALPHAKPIRETDAGSAPRP